MQINLSRLAGLIYKISVDSIMTIVVIFDNKTRS